MYQYMYSLAGSCAVARAQQIGKYIVHSVRIVCRPLAPALHHVSTCTSSATSRDQRTPCLHHEPPQVVLAVVRVGIRVPLLDLRLVARHLQLVLEAIDNDNECLQETILSPFEWPLCDRSLPTWTSPGHRWTSCAPPPRPRPPVPDGRDVGEVQHVLATTPPAGSTPGTARLLCTCTSPASQARPV